MLDADMEDYGFEYSDEEPEEQDVDIENQYYNTKGRCWSATLLEQLNVEVEAQLTSLVSYLYATLGDGYRTFWL